MQNERRVSARAVIDRIDPTYDQVVNTARWLTPRWRASSPLRKANLALAAHRMMTAAPGYSHYGVHPPSIAYWLWNNYARRCGVTLDVFVTILMLSECKVHDT